MSNSIIKTLSILALSAVAQAYYPSVAFATAYCADSSGICQTVNATDCTGWTYTCKKTRSGTMLSTNSAVRLHIKLTNEVALSTPAVNGFFNATTTSQANSAIECDYSASGNWDDTISTLCTAESQCYNFEAGHCSSKGGKNAWGYRISTMTCGTPGAGCKGNIDVHDPANFDDILEVMPFGDFDAIQGLDKQGCFSAFPDTIDLSKGQIGQITTICTKAEFDPNEKTVKQEVRGITGDGFSNYASDTSWFKIGDPTDCTSANFSVGSCNNNGGLWINAAPVIGQVTPGQCADYGKTLHCGELSNGDLGPTPADYGQTCQIKSGDCWCRCPNCSLGDSAEPLYNFTPDPSVIQYFISVESQKGSATESTVAACLVSPVGNGNN